MLNKTHIRSKTVVQILVYLLELLSVAFLLTLVTHHYVEPVTSCMRFLERMIFSYSIYQILVVVVLTNLNDIEKDAYLAYITMLKYCLVYAEKKDSQLKEYILTGIEKQLDTGVFNILEIRVAYESLKMNIDQIDEQYVKLEMISAEHHYEMASLNWKFSFLLRCCFFK